MNFEETWKNIGQHDDILNGLISKNTISKYGSNLPINKLKSNLLGGIFWAILLTSGYIFLLFVTKTWLVNVTLVIMSLFNCWVMMDSYKLYKLISKITPFNLKQQLESNYSALSRWRTLQQRASLFIYPVSVSGGFILGGVIGSGKPALLFLYDPKILVALAIAVIVLTPACYFLANWMFKIAYGKHMESLKAIIDELGE